MTVQLKDGRELEYFQKTESSPEQFKWPGKEIRDKEYALLKANAHFLFEHKEDILSNSRLFFAPINIQSGAAYTGALFKPTLGTYIEWWIARNEEALALYVSGSPLSGANVSKAITKTGKLVLLKPNGTFLNLMKEFNSMHKQYLDVRKECDAYTFEETLNVLKNLK